MQQAKFTVGKAQLDFLNDYSRFGFKDKSSMVRVALDYLRKQLDIKRLRESAELYAEIFEEDPDLRELTDSAISEWPE